jgi:hypothetical protein
MSVVLTAILGGQRYLYCRAMNEIMPSATCECAKARTSGDGTATFDRENDCVEARVLGRLASFAPVGDVLVVPPAALLVVLPSSLPEPRPSLGLEASAKHPIRAGPPGPTAARAQLMVFLT